MPASRRSSGFFSKDEILFRAFLTNKVIWVLAVATALMTAFYMFRLMSMTFFGAYRGPAWETAGHARRRSRRTSRRRATARRIPPIRTRTARRTKPITRCRTVRPTPHGARRADAHDARRPATATGRGTGRTNRRRR